MNQLLIIYQTLFKAPSNYTKDNKRMTPRNPIFLKNLDFCLILKVNCVLCTEAQLIGQQHTHSCLVFLGLEMYNTIPDRSYTLLSVLTYNNHKGFLLTLDGLTHSC